MTLQPSLFISHGAPNLLEDGSAAHHYLKTLGHDILSKRKLDAILIMSAHFEQILPTLTANPKPQTIYDFHGFPKKLYEYTYNAPGSHDKAILAYQILEKFGYEPQIDTKRGFDHGTWIPLSLMFPKANIPIIQLSINPNQTPNHHYKLGQALTQLRAQNILIIGTGNLTHNLQDFFAGSYSVNVAPTKRISEFTEWIFQKLCAGNVEAVLNTINQAPYGRYNHPTMDHIHPLFFAMGGGGANAVGRRLHASVSYGVLAMDVYAF